MNETPEVQEAAVEEAPTGPFMIETTDQFAHLMLHWHTNAVNNIKHLMEMPTGMEIVIEGEEPFPLEGDVQKGYKLGLDVAMNYFGTLPFLANTQHDDSKPH